MSFDGRKDPLRTIVGVKRQWSHLFHGGWGLTLTLECGHKVFRKGSREPKSRARCWECGQEERRKNRG